VTQRKEKNTQNQNQKTPRETQQKAELEALASFCCLILFPLITCCSCRLGVVWGGGVYVGVGFFALLAVRNV